MKYWKNTLRFHGYHSNQQSTTSRFFHDKMIMNISDIVHSHDKNADAISNDSQKNTAYF